MLKEADYVLEAMQYMHDSKKGKAAISKLIHPVIFPRHFQGKTERLEFIDTVRQTIILFSPSIPLYFFALVFFLLFFLFSLAI